MAGNEQLMSDSSRLYQRELPGGGYVAIELVREAAAGDMVEQKLERRTDAERRAGHNPPGISVAKGRPCRGRVSVERRAPGERRGGPEIPTLAEVERDDVVAVFNELYQIASDNVAIARGILNWQNSHRARA